jgi:MYXO-CTERM domain-containing protein
VPEHHEVIRPTLLAVAGAAVLAASASAHVTISPTASRPADLQQYRLLVPNEESDRDTTGIDVQLPAGVDAALAQTEAGWRARVVRQDGQPRLIRYRGGRIPPDGYFAFHVIVRNPVKTGTVTFKTLQHYSGDKIVRWIGGPDADQPSPRVALSESASPVDVVSVHGEKVPTGATAAKPALVKDEDDGDGPALPIAIAALALAVVALALSRRQAG